MQYHNFRYEKTPDGVILTQYLSAEQSTDLLAGSTHSLLFELADYVKRTEGTGEGKLEQRNHRIIAAESLPEPETELRIPSEIDGCPVVEIGPEAFSEYGALLTRIEVPSSVRRIGDGAFKMCMSLTELILEEGLESIGEEALYLTPLTDLTIPSTVTGIGCPWELGGITWQIAPGNPCYSWDGVGLYRSGELQVVSSQEELTTYTVPDGTIGIGENAFAGNGTITEVILPPTLQYIGTAAFESCQNLARVILPEGLRSIGADAFSHCICLKTLHLPSTLEHLGKNALSDTFGWSDSLIGLESISVAPGNPRFQADDAVLYESVDHSEYRHALSASRGNASVSFDDPNDSSQCSRRIVKYFGSAMEFSIPEDVTEILPGAFRRSGLHRIRIPKGMRDVARDAFRECSSLEEILLEESGTRLYVPREPVYRKEEITALFYSSEYASARRKRGQAEPASLPEKWQAFARTAVYDKKKDTGYEPYAEYLYDYRGYDALFHTYLNLPDQCGMACCRLKYPVLLGEEVRERYTQFLREHLSAIFADLAERQDMEHLAFLAELGFVTQDNIEDCIDVCSSKRRTGMVSYLLEYQREHFGEETFDFSL